ncbi:SAM-dependent methyltransferase [Celeribacter arenosi]|uniref:Methyltransferase domain-containing protein n=1 Tax=Celeribacter arenosi TaxID=792649 RepID=A0ABP7JXC7_9RHOB
MSNPTPLVDRDRLTRQRTRASRRGGDFFLHAEARFEIDDRLELVNRSFQRVAIVTGFPDIWREWYPDATVVPDDEILNLEERAYDLVIHAMALHCANDPVGQMIQCNRALVPDGLFLAVFFGDNTLTELRACLAEAEIALTGGLSPRVLPMGELSTVGALLQRASFALPVADKSSRQVTYASLDRLVSDLRDMGETAAMSHRGTPATRTLMAQTAALYSTHFGENDRLRATFDLICLTGWAPDASQPKPLMPGSATTRLADALKTREIVIPETE